MGKLLGFLAVVIFVSCAAAVGVAYAQTFNIPFTAEVSFAGAGTFGFTLYQSTSDALPNGTAGESVSTNTINWADTGATAGAAGYVNSRTYAVLEHDLNGSQAIFLYTDNVNGNKYKFTSTSVAANSAVVPSFVETAAPYTEVDIVPSRAIDLAYIIISSSQYSDKNRSKSGNASGISGISDIKIGLDSSYNSLYGTGFVLDISKDGAGKGQVIANIYGYWYGNADYDYYPGVNTYMFFSAAFEKALKGFHYGTDSLTIELVANP
ncbi:MAG: hypothetical protein LBO62_02515 [Endomicrobium sp.]|jgi:hypothetical protein|nr:hypothetical protein [Endomicrobium sp.]